MQAQPVNIERVRRRARRETISFLVGGSRGAGRSRAKAKQLARMLDDPRWTKSILWRARRGRRYVAAAAIITNPGRTGMAIYSPLTCDGVDAVALSELLRAASLEAISDGAAYVQAMIDPAADDEAVMLQSAGLERLAELVRMELDLNDATFSVPDNHLANDLTWRSYGQFDDDELAGVIRATYGNSRDCPEMIGIRDTSDIIAGYKAGGFFRPSGWLIANIAQEPVGCILVNDSPAPTTSEIVYMGVSAAFRGRSLGRIMLARACGAAAELTKRRLSLAVDATNLYALRLYESACFYEVFRRSVYIMTPKSISTKPRSGAL